MNMTKLISMILISGVVALAFLAPAMGQGDIKASLFAVADSALSNAKKAQADILAPKSFDRAMKLYTDAEKDLEKGKNLDDIRKKLTEAGSYFDKSTEASELGRLTLEKAIAAREDAKEAGSATYSTETWGKAEAKFREGAAKLEDGDINNARKKGGEAEQIYRQAELEAIKASYLKETWGLLETANDKYRRRSREDHSRADKLAKEAESELIENRYDTDRPRSLARQANYEAKHAIYLGKTVQEMERGKKSFEDAMLLSEEPLREIAAVIDIAAEFDEGYGKTTGQVIEHLKSLQDANAKLTQDVTDRDEELKNMGARVVELEAQLGGIAQEKTALTKQMEAQAEMRARFAAVEGMFDSETANVFRDGNKVIIRVTGINFASGRADINPQNFELLTSVEKAIDTFPACHITVEGHTDSYGSDEKNLELSEERAVAVKAYLMANMNLDSTRIDARGLGETYPIANNETPEGRTKNRRIEVIIQPQTGAEAGM